MHFAPWLWALALAGAFGIGVSKTGISGLGTLAVSLFAIVYQEAHLSPAASAGAVLPILIACDFVAVQAYHQHAEWPHLWRLIPWAAAGIGVGWFTQWGLHHLYPPTLGHPGSIADVGITRLIGIILITVAGLQYWRQRTWSEVEDVEAVPHGLWFIAAIGLLAGFTTMVANAAGPIMILYLLSMRLPKMRHMGTIAWYYLILNCFKVPFSASLGYITRPSLEFDVLVIPCALLGAFCGKPLLRHLNQKLFEDLALGCTVVAAVKLLLG